MDVSMRGRLSQRVGDEDPGRVLANGLSNSMPVAALQRSHLSGRSADHIASSRSHYSLILPSLCAGCGQTSIKQLITTHQGPYRTEIVIAPAVCLQEHEALLLGTCVDGCAA